MFSKKTSGLDIARKLVKVTGIQETIEILQKIKNPDPSRTGEYFKLVLALSDCNLVQTLKEDIIASEFEREFLDSVIRDYVFECIRVLATVRMSDDQEVETFRTAVQGISKDLQEFWKDEEELRSGGPGPRYYCVKEVLKRLNDEGDFDVHDALFEHMYLEHKNIIDLFRESSIKTK
jgi:hypothetical protein